ncbi:MAG: hypothetical protein NTV82_11510 [Candidatus Aminicenantes bacterium]|jgi:hypothetical protein|nr:hypothetical protein [Candidatus Aminicenantes bacterium]
MVGGENRHNDARSAIVEKNEILIHYKNFYLYFVRVDLRQLSRENMLIEPFFFEAVPSAR